MDSNVMELRLREWLPIFEEQAKSGLNKQEWCKQNGIKRYTFFKWQKECRKYLLSKNEMLPANIEPSFVEISCSPGKAGTAAASSVTDPIPMVSPLVISCNGFSVSVNGQVDEISLAKVLKVISYAH